MTSGKLPSSPAPSRVLESKRKCLTFRCSSELKRTRKALFESWKRHLTHGTAASEIRRPRTHGARTCVWSGGQDSVRRSQREGLFLALSFTICQIIPFKGMISMKRNYLPDGRPRLMHSQHSRLRHIPPARSRNPMLREPNARKKEIINDPIVRRRTSRLFQVLSRRERGIVYCNAATTTPPFIIDRWPGVCVCEAPVYHPTRLVVELLCCA